ncbi:MAG: hypothetical protein F6J90_12375 [Moorea sp. SIOASIH]|uniref:hypothetical protein n=1 Tax=Moorena sp. SIOASIH TaxID=2607817 RepID=UPI0013BE5A7B|nr:hypothetical protein [Moorena sp. SIOASIH]NEO37062.1 hypothetical protein [Moorena sp. SIOASIH]
MLACLLLACLLPLASCLLPLAFPSWSGLGVGSSCLLPVASCLSKKIDTLRHYLQNG